MRKYILILFAFIGSFANAQGYDFQQLCLDCVEQNGFYCGDDPANWTQYSPNGCVPNGEGGLMYLNDGWEDCVDGSDENGAVPTPAEECGPVDPPDGCDTIYVDVPVVEISALKKHWDGMIGFHAHDNMLLACANTNEAIKNGIPLVIFPSGHVSTADRFGFGKVVDAPWTTFAAKLIKESNATVVPIFFRGQNSRLFHVASHISMAFRSALLLNEARKRFGKTVEIEIGDPIPWRENEAFTKRKDLTDFLYAKVQSLQ